jgi:hypothetical protein
LLILEQPARRISNIELHIGDRTDLASPNMQMEAIVCIYSEDRVLAPSGVPAISVSAAIVPRVILLSPSV